MSSETTSKLTYFQFSQLKIPADKKANSRDLIKISLETMFKYRGQKHVSWQKIYAQLSVFTGHWADSNERRAKAKNCNAGSGDDEIYMELLFWLYFDYGDYKTGNLTSEVLEHEFSDEALFRRKCKFVAYGICFSIWGRSAEDQHALYGPRQTKWNRELAQEWPNNYEQSQPGQSVEHRSSTPLEFERSHPPLIPLPRFDQDTQVSWLNPFREDAIPFVPRVEERQKLEDFISSKKPFQICALIGPSGAGKTRFAAELMRDLDDTNSWITGFVDKDDPASTTSWVQWEPYQQNTLIVVDYTYATGELVNTIIKKCDPQSRRGERYSGKSVRLLLLNHVFDQSPFFDGALTQHRIDYFHDHSPIELRGGDHLLRQIVKQTSGNNDESEKHIDQAIVHLKTMGQAAQHPLFAALIGQTIKDGVDFKNWSRRDLIDNYLNSSIRLPWLADQGPDQTGRWIGILISISTLLRGADRYTLISAIPDGVGSTKSQDVMTQCMTIVSSSDASTLKQLEPDILGESYFLQFLKFALVNKSVMSAFVDTLYDASTQKDEEIIVENFVESIKRLAKNLANDKTRDQSRDQSYIEQVGDEARADWNNLLKFLTSSDFPRNSVFQTIRFIVLSKVTEVLNEAGLKHLADQFYSHVDFADIPENVRRSHFLGVLEAFIFTYEYSISNGTNCQEFDQYFSKFTRHFEDNTGLSISPQIFATLTGSVSILDRQLNHGAPVNEPDADGKTALMYAAESGLLPIIQRLCEEDLLLIDNVDDDGNTALFYAAKNNHYDAVDQLLLAGASINLRNHQRDTALSEAIRFGCLETVDVLLKNRAEIVGKHRYQYSALMYASMRDHEDIVLRLLDEPTVDVNETNRLGQSALMVACTFGAYDAVDTLLNSGAYVDHQDCDGYTALMKAARNMAHGQEQTHIVKRILEEKPNIDLRQQYGKTAIEITKDAHNYNISIILEKYINS